MEWDPGDSKTNSNFNQFCFYPPTKNSFSTGTDAVLLPVGKQVGEAEREVVKKPRSKGGKGLPNLYLFLGNHYTALHLTLATSPGNY